MDKVKRHICIPSGKSAQHTLINRQDLELGSELGQGEFGSVLRGVWKDPRGNKVKCPVLSLNTIYS